MNKDKAQAILEAAQADVTGGVPFDIFYTESGPVNVPWKDACHRAICVRKNEHGAFVNGDVLPNEGGQAGTALYLGMVVPDDMVWPSMQKAT